jgi:para-aminobenzoate synthetase/4-amino-4-deoxychorismate lyase
VLVSMRYLPPGETIVLLENSLDPDGTSWLYQDPEDIITCAAPADVEACIAALQSAVDGGAYVAGFFSYEMGYLLEPGLRHLLPEDRPQPLLWFGVFDRRDRLDKNQLEDFWLERCRGRVGALG